MALISIPMLNDHELYPIELIIIRILILITMSISMEIFCYQY